MKLLNIIIMTPREVVFSGKALAVSSVNSNGKFDILPEHANFITIVQSESITIHLETGERNFNFPQAIIYQKANSVSIFAEPKLTSF